MTDAQWRERAAVGGLAGLCRARSERVVGAVIIEVSQADAEETTRRLAREEGLFAGVCSGGAIWAALEVSREVTEAVIVTIICDRYLSTGVFG